MFQSIVLPLICAANLRPCAQWFVHLQVIMNHPLLTQEERYLWLWLASQSADNHLEYSFNYEQVSNALNKPPKVIHRLLFRLRIVGLLQGDIPAWYAEPSKQMVKEMRHIKVLFPPACHKDIHKDNGVFLPNRNKPILINLIKRGNHGKHQRINDG